MTLHRAATAIAMTILCAGAADAATVQQTQTILNSQQAIRASNNPFVLTFSGLAPAASSGTLTIFGRGDLNADAEYINASVDATSFGRIRPTTSEFSVTYTITQSDLNGFLADGSLIVTLNLSPGVDLVSSTNRLSATLDYEDTSVVPLPASAAFALTGLAGLGLAGRRRRKRAAL
ncbi:hypothetical protein [Poseidonocella sedimentorum]|uniref:VPLPA-CTERM protein sorting domain-containing protein n=1 Tax=Poseidonocella sedimentorum TaxID=871652 RepID=A0A1I6EEX2_9RHOB|nr:hypothetical protein [Poseidonocella sedimentorum]SFR16283.1 VPLPA-CTERM protein sorting domain-containing protein [Poseidonocella sedimentorum]